MAVINYIMSCNELRSHEIQMIDSMRRKGISIKYYGRHVDPDFLTRNEKDIRMLISKLRGMAEKRLNN